MGTTSGAGFRAFKPEDAEACMALFDANCPAYFAPNEREEYAGFLASSPADYEVCTITGADTLVGAFGLVVDGAETSLRWIMIDPARQGRGLGSAIMRRVVETVAGAVVHIAASHRSAPFFARFGAETVLETPDGWGPGMHRIDMELRVQEGAGP